MSLRRDGAARPNAAAKQDQKGRFRILGLRIGDLLLMAGLLAAAGIAWGMRSFGAEPAAVAVISIEGERVRQIALEAESDGMHTFTDRGVTYTLEISESRVRMAQIDCPDHICIKTGWADRQTPIVCMPNRLVIELEGEGS